VVRSNSSSLAVAVAVPAVLAAVTAYLVWKSSSDDENDKAAIVEDMIQKRRSIYPKDYDPDRPVPKTIIDKMLYGAMYAPNHGKTKPWRFVVFSGAEQRQALGELEQQLYKQLSPTDQFKQAKYDKKLTNKQRSSCVIAICMVRQPSEKIPEIEEVEAVACAVQNMHLIASAHGVGAYWSSGPLVYSKEYKDYLGLTGEKDQVLGMFHVGYPRADKKWPTVEARTKDVEDKVTWKL